MSDEPINLRRLRVVHYPHPVLRTPAEPVETIDDEVRAVADRMIELMIEHDGVGLAAPQVGLPWRMFVTRAADAADEHRVFINPSVELVDRTLEPHDEGCLSLPGLTAEIRRPLGVRIRAEDPSGEPFTLEAAGYVARVWQHELDHLDGVLIIDKMTTRDRLANRKAIRQLELAAGD